MNKKFLNYTDWQGTADTLHMYLQMLGKVKLMRCHQRPEWAHVRLYLTVEGVPTGIIPGDDSPFEIQANFMKHLVIFRNGNGKVVTFTLQNGLSVMDSTNSHEGTGRDRFPDSDQCPCAGVLRSD